MNFTSKIKMFLCVFPVLPENKAKPTCLSPYRGGYHPPDPGLITNQVRWMVKCSATAKSFPRGGASRSESVQCTVSPGISKFIAASHRPLPPRRAGAPSPKGRSWRQPFVDTIQPGLYRKRCASGRMLSSPTVGGGFWLAPFNRVYALFSCTPPLISHD